MAVVEIPVTDPAKLRLVQAATDGPWRPGIPSPVLSHVIRLEPSGRAVATNNVLIVVAEDTVAPFEGEPLHIILDAQIPKTAKAGIFRGETLITDKGEIGAKILSESSFPPLTPYYNYSKVLDRVAAGAVHPRGEYRWNHAQLDRLVKAHPDWPKHKFFDLTHVTDMSVQIDMRIEGVTALLKLAVKPQA